MDNRFIVYGRALSWAIKVYLMSIRRERENEIGTGIINANDKTVEISLICFYI